MSFQIETAQRSQAKLRIGLSAPSGGGKTYSALKLGYGLCNKWDKIGVIDTEQHSSSLYADLGKFKIINFEPPFKAERYIEAVHAFEEAGMEVIIIDSVTHVWKGEGGLLEFQNSLGGRFQDWAKVTPLYQRFIQSILQSKAHVITTIRKKESYAMSTEDGKSRVIKQGLDDEIRDGFSYELTVAFNININHLAEPSKDRTGLFMKSDGTSTGFMITSDTGKMLKKWAESGIPEKTKELAPLITEFQRKKIFALGKVLGYDSENTKKMVKDFFKVDHFNNVSQEQAGKMITAMMVKTKTVKQQEVNEDIDPDDIDL